LWAQVAHKNPHEQDFKGRGTVQGKKKSDLWCLCGQFFDQQWSNMVSWGQNQLFFS